MERDTGLWLFVCGGHDVRNVHIVKHVLGAVREQGRLSTIVETGDRAGMVAREWAHDRYVTVMSIFGSEEDWLTSTAKIRRLVDEGRPDLAISFDTSQRSMFFMERMTREGVRTYVVPDQISRRFPLAQESEPAIAHASP
jgi:hypothetical protein